MCDRPITQDGNTFSCRTCDGCIAARRANWVGRAMAEKAIWPFAFAITLTYSDETQESRDGAAFFAYHHVRAFCQRLTSAVRRRDKRHKIKFLCAGEQGDRNKRCHWHIIIFSSYDIRKLGTVHIKDTPIHQPEQMLSEGKRVKRLTWSLWPYGFSVFQEPEEHRMSYILSYCLKDQFTVEKSAGTKRESKSENFATGLFRMSKRPAIGLTWLAEKIERLAESNSVLPDTEITVPGLSYYWYPNGTIRHELMWAMRAIYQKCLWQTGQPPNQWSSLLAACQDNPKDMEILNGKENDEETSIERSLALRAVETADRQAVGKTVRRCGNVYPCWTCRNSLSDYKLSEIGLARYVDSDGQWSYHEIATGKPPAAGWQQPAGKINPYCHKIGTPEIDRAFPSSAKGRINPLDM